mmetsp:Transcript_32162/g.80711  ORF Transcript_32162/g.80711 Transcript_32162/m.80711 type:complete len:115 (+) Transcript_32162:314-658(+)
MAVFFVLGVPIFLGGVVGTTATVLLSISVPRLSPWACAMFPAAFGGYFYIRNQRARERLHLRGAPNAENMRLLATGAFFLGVGYGYAGFKYGQMLFMWGFMLGVGLRMKLDKLK